MKLLLELLLNERYVNLLTPTDKEKYVDVVWDMMQQAYKPIGGFKSATSKDDLIQDTNLWKLVKRGDKIVSAAIYKDKNGRKSIAIATDGTLQGKSDLVKMKSDDIRLHRSWCESSGKAESFLKRLGAKPVSNKFAAKLTGKEILGYDVDGIHYTRLIQGEPHVKGIYGFPHLTDEMKDELKQEKIALNHPE